MSHHPTDELLSDDTNLPCLHGPVLPISPAPSTEAYFGLLTDPEGRYGHASYGNTTALTLRGSGEFVAKAENLFSSFGGESIRGPLGYHYATSVTIRQGTAPNVSFFCMPPHRAKTALRLYFHGQLSRSSAAHWVDKLDEEGDFIETTLLNSDVLMNQAARLAESFYLYEIGPDYGAIPELISPAGATTEYTFEAPDEMGLDRED